MAFEESSFIQRLWRAYDHHLPSEDVLVIDEAGREAFHGVLVQFSELLADEKSSLSQLINRFN